MSELNTKFTPKRQEIFLQSYLECGTIYKAARAADVSCETVRRTREENPDFDLAMKEAYEGFQAGLEEEAITRAVTGWEEQVYHQGMPCGAVRKKSDRILELVLKRHIPAYRDKQQIEVTVPGVLVVPGTAKTSKEWEEEG